MNQLSIMPVRVRIAAELRKAIYAGEYRSGDELSLEGICLVAGLGPEDNRRRDGTFAYYISEPVVRSDAKGVAPFLLCYTEVKRLKG